MGGGGGGGGGGELETCPSLPYVALSTTISPTANGGFAVFTVMTVMTALAVVV